MSQVGPGDGIILPQQHRQYPEHAPCDRQPFFLTKEVIPVVTKG
jgi:hypothetical protein